ncbi:MAG: 2-amino-4-hydroxy-6-hydroxymethyldihydropteridine diphosphokinase [Anaerolineae bacterium]
MNRVVILLGSNIDKEKNLPLAVRMLAGQCRVAAVSPVYETVPAGLLDQPNFYNAAVLIETGKSAAQIKEGLLGQIENRLGRMRQADKNAPRTIDADLVLFNDEAFEYNCEDGSCRRVPDPDLLRFAHVAVPVADLVGDMPHPETGEPIARIAQRLLQEAGGDGRLPLWPCPDVQLDIN